MAEYAVMPAADYKDACDAVREKTGGTENIKSGALGAQIRSIDTQENLTEELSAQDMLIAQIAAALVGKAAGGGSEEKWIGDGNTHVWIHLEEGRTSPMLGCCPNGTVTVDWGDGTTPDTLTGTSESTVLWTGRHNYAEPGDYVITLTVDGTMGLYGVNAANAGGAILRYSSAGDNLNGYYRNAVQKVEIGSGVANIAGYAFSWCRGIKSVYIPNGVTSIGSSAFYGCYGIESIHIPDGIDTIGSSVFDSCYSLKTVHIPDGAKVVGGSVFVNCYSLKNVHIPDSVTSIGSNVFTGFYTLESIKIPGIVGSIANSMFATCHSLRSIHIPDGVTSIGTSAFSTCHSLTSVHIPDGVTSIGNSAFASCYNLATINKIPASVKSIGSNVFYNCNTLARLRFESATPPTVSNSNAFTGIPTDCIISVPVGRLSAYKSATNYPSSGTYTYIEE